VLMIDRDIVGNIQDHFPNPIVILDTNSSLEKTSDALLETACVDALLSNMNMVISFETK